MQVLPRVFYDYLVQFYDKERGIVPRNFAKDIDNLKLCFEYDDQKGYLQFKIKTYNGVLCKDDSMPINTGATYFLLQTTFEGTHAMFIFSVDSEKQEYICLDSQKNRLSTSIT